MLGKKGSFGLGDKVFRPKSNHVSSSAHRPYKPSEFPSPTRGLGKVSRSGSSTGSATIKKAKLSESLRSHKSGSASRSTIVGSAKPRRRIMNGVNQALLAKILTILAFVAVGAVGLCLILVSAKSGAKQVTEPEEVIELDPLHNVDSDNAMTVNDTGGTATLVFGGSIKLQDEVIRAASAGDGFDFNNYLSDMKSVMTADISMVNVVGTVDGFGGNKNIKGYPAPNYPAQIVDAMRNIGVNFAATPGSFALTNGFDAMSATIKKLSSNGITPVGTYSSAETGNTVCVKRVNSISVGIGAYNCVTGEELAALKNEQRAAGVTDEQMEYCINQLDITSATSEILKDVAAMREAGAQFIVICLNWGSANITTPTYEMRALAQDMIDHGIDLTVGYGADIPLRVTVKDYKTSEGSKKCYVFYSLGNLLSDTSSGSVQSEQESMVVKFTVSRAAGSDKASITAANYYPVYSNRDEMYATEKTYLKYRVVPASLYVDAQSLPSAFSTDTQWNKCKTTFTDIRTLVGDKMVLGELDSRPGDAASSDNSAPGEDTDL